ncbi:unnamed protein product [Pieris brassicae]|uniref:Uncharacterized protein n=1 Tax=Pieris brassicae TaxID=7116 RepID=A0A9P0TF93_PIEBR|nr:unnamed protein product [Pieris brassicae]
MHPTGAASLPAAPEAEVQAMHSMDWLFKKERIYLLAQFWQQVTSYDSQIKRQSEKTLQKFLLNLNDCLPNSCKLLLVIIVWVRWQAGLVDNSIISATQKQSENRLMPTL